MSPSSHYHQSRCKRVDNAVEYGTRTLRDPPLRPDPSSSRRGRAGESGHGATRRHIKRLIPPSRGYLDGAPSKKPTRPLSGGGGPPPRVFFGESVLFAFLLRIECGMRKNVMRNAMFGVCRIARGVILIVVNVVCDRLALYVPFIWMCLFTRWLARACNFANGHFWVVCARFRNFGQMIGRFSIDVLFGFPFNLTNSLRFYFFFLLNNFTFFLYKDIFIIIDYYVLYNTCKNPFKLSIGHSSLEFIGQSGAAARDRGQRFTKWKTSTILNGRLR